MNKRNRLMTFLCSLIPGAGEMYFGKYKTGLSLMGMFAGIFAAAVFLEMEELLFGLPLVWFYSFFHVHNLKRLSAEEFAQQKDELVFLGNVDREKFRTSAIGSYKVWAFVLIALGVILIWNNFRSFLWYIGIRHEAADFLAYRLPQIIIGIGVIAVGIGLIRGKKSELYDEDGHEEAAARKTVEQAITVPGKESDFRTEDIVEEEYREDAKASDAFQESGEIK